MSYVIARLQGKPVPHSNTIRLSTVGNTLRLQLNRFTQRPPPPRSDGVALEYPDAWIEAKITQLVAAPVVGLDCSRFMEVSPGTHVFDLISVLNHVGGRSISHGMCHHNQCEMGELSLRIRLHFNKYFLLFIARSSPVAQCHTILSIRKNLPRHHRLYNDSIRFMQTQLRLSNCVN